MSHIIRRESHHLIRFADDFILIGLTKHNVYKAKNKIEAFLNIRGLSPNLVKSRVHKWFVGKKFDFLGWTFHLLVVKKTNWLTSFPKNTFTRLKNGIKLYIYPSNKSTKNFRTKVKELLSLKNVSLTPLQAIKRLNLMIECWDNYFLPSPNQYSLRARLDRYVFYRSKQ